MLRAIMLVAELVLVAMSLFIADASQARIKIIPHFIVLLPEVDYTSDDFWTVFLYFLVVHLLVFIAMQWRLGPWIVDDAKRTAEEVFALGAAFAISTLGVFVTTSVAFDPHLIAGIGLSNGILFLSVYLLAAVVKRSQPVSAFIDLLLALKRRLLSTTGVLVVILALSPAILAKVFVSDRDVANFITQIRIYLSDNSAFEYTLVNALGNTLFHQPMLARTAPNDQAKLYILERAGQLVSIPYPSGGDVQTKLDIRKKVGKVEIENGALGFDFHPEFGKSGSENRGYVYIYYTDVRKGKQVNRVSRFDLNAGSLEEVSMTEMPLIALPRGASGFHNGGSVEFGPNGFLYIALGEGVRTKNHRSQASTLRKGILRIDVDRQGGEVSHPISRRPANGKTLNYFIPNDNPFVGSEDILEEYWAIGLRNPFRISFDPKTNELWAGDVGTTKWEEINLIKKGGHYQYPFVEGNEGTGIKKPSQIMGVEYGPVYTYVHTAYDRAVIGGIVYRGDKIPQLGDLYIFGDNYSAKVFAMPADRGQVKHVTHLTSANQFAQRGVSSLSQIPNGDILVTTLGRSEVPTGEVLRLVRSNEIYEFSQKDNEQKAKIPKISSREVQTIFVTNCARCHGVKGRGDGPDSLSLEVAVPDFSSHEFQSSRTDEQLRLVILKGGNEVGLSQMMPPWEEILEASEVDAVVKLLREFND